MVWTSTTPFDELRWDESRFAKRVGSRDRIETIAALILTAILVPIVTLTWRMAGPLITAGLVLMGLYSLAVPIVLWRARRRVHSPDLPLADYRQAVIERYDRQIAMLKWAWLWYVGPVWVSSMLIYGGVLQLAGDYWPRLAFMAIVTTVFSYLVARANWQVSTKELTKERNRLAEAE